MGILVYGFYAVVSGIILHLLFWNPIPLIYYNPIHEGNFTSFLLLQMSIVNDLFSVPKEVRDEKSFGATWVVAAGLGVLG